MTRSAFPFTSSFSLFYTSCTPTQMPLNPAQPLPYLSHILAHLLESLPTLACPPSHSHNPLTLCTPSPILPHITVHPHTPSQPFWASLVHPRVPLCTLPTHTIHCTLMYPPPIASHVSSYPCIPSWSSPTHSVPLTHSCIPMHPPWPLLHLPYIIVDPCTPSLYYTTFFAHIPDPLLHSFPYPLAACWRRTSNFLLASPVFGCGEPAGCCLT